MADFKYVAVDAQGKTQSGELTAKDAKEARSSLRKQRLTPLKLSIAGGTENSKRSRSRLTANSSAETDRFGNSKTLRKGSAKGEKIGLEFLKRLHELHGSGMPIADAVKLLNHRLSDPGQREIAGFLWKELAEGRTLSRAMRQLPQFFNESSTFVIEAGEATGNATPILQKIIVHLEEKKEKFAPRFWEAWSIPSSLVWWPSEWSCFSFSFLLLRSRKCWRPWEGNST